MVKVLICGYYGAYNRGDELILKVLTDHLKSRGARVTVTSLDPAATARDYGVRAVRSRRSLRKGLFPFVRELLGADLFILGGGGLYQDYGRHFRVVLYYGMRVLIAGLLRKKIAYFALGFGNIELERSRRFIRTVTRYVDSISVRDQGSREFLETLGVHREIKVCADPVFCLGREASAGAKGEPLEVGISVLAYDEQLSFATGADLKVESSVISLTRELLKRGCRVTFIPMERGTDDRFIAGMLERAGLSAAVSLLDSSLEHDPFIAAFSRFDAVVGMRLHAVILSAALGIPFLPISYHSKVARTVALLGQEDLLIPLEELSPERLQEGFAALLKNYAARRAVVAASAARLKRDAEGLFSHLDALG